MSVHHTSKNNPIYERNQAFSDKKKTLNNNQRIGAEDFFRSQQRIVSNSIKY